MGSAVIRTAVITNVACDSQTEWELGQRLDKFERGGVEIVSVSWAILQNFDTPPGPHRAHVLVTLRIPEFGS